MCTWLCTWKQQLGVFITKSSPQQARYCAGAWRACFISLSSFSTLTSKLVNSCSLFPHPGMRMKLSTTTSMCHCYSPGCWSGCSRSCGSVFWQEAWNCCHSEQGTHWSQPSSNSHIWATNTCNANIFTVLNHTKVNNIPMIPCRRPMFKSDSSVQAALHLSVTVLHEC